MSLVQYLLLVFVVGVVVTLIVSFVPDQYFAPQFKKLLVVAAVIVLVLILVLAILGGTGWDVKIPSVR
jgi:hypothetical protein